MKLFLIGHRGVGKTSLAQRLEVYFDYSVPVFDLDAEIEREEGKEVFSIFKNQGEDYFRRRELEVFHRLCEQNSSLILALGAGFRLDRAYFPKGVDVLWVMRNSDAEGRIFTNRPRLNPGQDYLQEYYNRFEEREILFHRFSTRYYLMPEGLDAVSEVERKLFVGKAERQGGILTLDAAMVKRWSSIVSNLGKWNFDWIELRDDLLSDDEIEEILPSLLPERTLLSFRRSEPSSLFVDLAKAGYAFDWPDELPKEKCPPLKPSVVSSHTEVRPLWSGDGEVHLKWSPVIEDWGQLEMALHWQMESPRYRSLLPRSKNGKWHWVRLLLKGRQKMNFLRLGRFGVPDQPSLFEWAGAPGSENGFAAVLGKPIHHSWSPCEQMDFFNERNRPFYRIEFSEAEAEQAWKILNKLGLVAAAVTSPLKNWMYVNSVAADAMTDHLKSVNTVVRSGGSWIGKNTDLIGFQELVRDVYDLNPVLVWGGGGTQPVIAEVLPAARFHSSRTGQIKSSGLPLESSFQEEPMKTLIWAAPPDAATPDDVPGCEWSPLRVVDLNYKESSSARSYALTRRAQYISGAKMFRVQAEAQREFWGKYL